MLGDLLKSKEILQLYFPLIFAIKSRKMKAETICLR